MANKNGFFGNPLREAPGQRGRKLPRLDLTGQNVGAPRHSPTAVPVPKRDVAPVSPTAAPAIDPRITQTNQAAGGALGQVLDFGNQALGDVSALATRVDAGLIGGLGRVTGLVAPETGSALLAVADKQRAAADVVARLGLFPGATATDFGQPVQPTAAQAQPAAAQAQPAAAQAQPVAAQAQPVAAQAQPVAAQPGSAVALALGQQMPDLANLPLDMGTREGGADPAFVVERHGMQEPIWRRLGEPQADGRRRVLPPATFNIGGQDVTVAQAERLAPLLGQLVGAQGNIAAAKVRALTPKTVDPANQAGQQIFDAARDALTTVLQDSEATPEERANALKAWRDDMQFLVQNGLTDAQGIAQLAQALGR